MLPTVTIESTRAISTFDMGLLLGSLVAAAAVGWMTLVHRRHHRQR